jgi:hypothetical protein
LNWSWLNNTDWLKEHDLIRSWRMRMNGDRQAIEAKLHVYGPVRLDEGTFINVYLSKLRNELQEKLSEAELLSYIFSFENDYKK